MCTETSIEVNTMIESRKTSKNAFAQKKKIIFKKRRNLINNF